MKYLVALLALAGLVVSVMGLRIHNMDPAKAPPCAVSEHWDCGAVNHSRFAVFPAKTFDEAPGKVHIPVATVGIVGYGLIVVLALMERWWLVFEAAQLELSRSVCDGEVVHLLRVVVGDFDHDSGVDHWDAGVSAARTKSGLGIEEIYVA
jgi:hypothetical protein